MARLKPVLDSLVAVSKRVRADMEKTEGVVDVDDYSDAPHDKVHFQLDREKAALSGVSVAQVAETLRIAAAGQKRRHRFIWTANANRWKLPCNYRVRSARRFLIYWLYALKTGQGDFDTVK